MIPRKQHVVLSNIIFEFLLLNLSILVVFQYKAPEFSAWIIESEDLFNFFTLLTVFNAIWLFIVLFNGDQNAYLKPDFRKRLKYQVINTFLFIGITSTIAIIFKLEYFNRTILMLPIFIFAFLNLFVSSLLFEYLKRKKTVSDSNILLVSSGTNRDELKGFSKRIQHLGYEIVGYLRYGTSKKMLPELKPLGRLNDLPRVLDKKRIDEIFITGQSLKDEELEKLIKVADFRGIRVNFVPESPLFQGGNLKTKSLNGLSVFQHRQTPLDNFQGFILKRAFDIVFSMLVLILLFPVFLAIALLIYLDGKGPVLYAPYRKGESGDTFKCYKFRTMSVCDNPVNGTKSTVKNDPRITRIGKYLRKFDLDELPQFFNVLKGEMSVVGPRPHRTHLQNDFRKIVNNYMVRHYVKPGITGWAQVNGWRGPTETPEQKKGRIKHDLWYIENWNFGLDIKIIFLTVFGKKTRFNAF